MCKEPLTGATVSRIRRMMIDRASVPAVELVHQLESTGFQQIYALNSRLEQHGHHVSRGAPRLDIPCDVLKAVCTETAI